jgi:hypothetical protein
MACASFPAVRVQDGVLVTGAASDRFFGVGMVYSDSMMLSSYGTGEGMEHVLAEAAQQGSSMLRWNAFLKGLDLRFGSDGLVEHMPAEHAAALRDAADRAQAHGLLLQIVLSTAHFLRCGWGGCDATLRCGQAGKNTCRVRNLDRVDHNLRMMATDDGINAYLERIVSPALDALGAHPALFGFLIVNEGYFMVRQTENLFTYLTDRTLTLQQLRRFVNRVAGLST